MQNSKNKILIIGAKGMLGQELVKLFKKDECYKITAWDRENLDISSQKEVDKKIVALNPKIIINAAAYNAVDKCEEDKNENKLAIKINGQAPGYLAKITKKIGAVLVHYSTNYVFDGSLEKFLEPAGCTHSCQSCGLHKNFQPVLGYDEDSKPNPISKYGRSKLAGEKAVQKIGGKYYIIRLSKLFGKPAKSESAKKSFFGVMLDLGRKNKSVKVVDEEISNFTYAPDLAKKTKEIIEAKKTYGIYHVTNSGSATWYEAVLELYKLAKIKTKVIPVSAEEFPRPAKRPAFSALINTKLNPLRNYKLALKDFLKNEK